MPSYIQDKLLLGMRVERPFFSFATGIDNVLDFIGHYSVLDMTIYTFSFLDLCQPSLSLSLPKHLILLRYTGYREGDVQQLCPKGIWDEI